MAKYNYNEYAVNKEKEGSFDSSSLVKTHFMNEFLNKDGDWAIIRFPYRTMNDVSIESGHMVQGVFPNNFYGKFVTCTGDDNCPLCASEDFDVRKIVNRCYVKLIVYTTKDGNVVLNPTVWERKAFFADNELKNLITEYEDLTQVLFKIIRTGSGTSTRYNILPILNKTMYPDDAYVADFSCLETLDPVRILAKTPQQYLAALNSNKEKEQSDVNTNYASQTTSSFKPRSETINPSISEKPQANEGNNTTSHGTMSSGGRYRF